MSATPDTPGAEIGSTDPSPRVDETADRTRSTTSVGLPDLPVPLADDAVDAAERDRVFEGLFQRPPAREQLGRYVVLGTLGQGGMGTVLEAFDRTLDRRVALKVLRSDLDDRHTRRLLREAQALAKLSHPNVVQVYEAGEADGRAYIAMELVQGRSLRSWLESRPSWQECVRVYRQAGEGLAAAHARGLIHRDFKPGNVVMDDEGRVRVLDFGLARRAEDTETEEEPGPVDLQAHDSALDAALTRTGSVLGTPAYMAPEQIRGRPADARSDQFSFCVALFEALYGTRPFNGATLAAQMMAIGMGQIAEPEESSSVPRWLREIVVRGLAPLPDDRFADMDALLHELSRVRTRGRWAVVAAGIGLVGATTAVLAWSDADPCQIDETALAGTWDPERREALRAALTEGGSDPAIAERSLTRWGDAWLAGMRSACEATHVAGTQSEALLDRRTGCLERQRRQVTAIVDVLGRPDGAGAGYVLELLGELPDSAICADPRLAETTQPLPRDLERREAILTAYEQIGHARALIQASGLDEADELGDRLESETAALDYQPLSLEVRSLTGERFLSRQRVDEAVPILRNAIRDAEIAGLDELTATLRTRFATAIVGLWGRPELQAMVLDEAETSVRRLERPDDRRALRLELARSIWLDDAGDFEGALAGYRASLEQARASEDGFLVWRAQHELGKALVRVGRYDEAAKTLAQARTHFVKTWGSSATIDARVELALGVLELKRGRFAEAEDHLEAARSLFEPIVGKSASDLSALDEAEAKLALMTGDLERADEAFVRVIATASDDLRRAEAWEAVGAIRYYRDDFNGSLDAYRRAQPLFLATFGAKNPRIGVLLGNIGESLAALGDHQEAMAMFADALDLLGRVLPPDHIFLAQPYKGRAKSRIALGDLSGARIDLERALQLHEHNPGEPLEHADVERTLAELLLAAGEDTRARQLATAARRHLADIGNDEAVAEITTWLEQHQPTMEKATLDVQQQQQQQ